ncbi:MAG: FKBP-type peptidyl-prolyl cis-trans isomerase N-terminal domain-containing protein [Chitinophagaceae bacterium]|nr:FKBP-type peptidyl-prolyl cis-trans isomerase N-terminal domain-containing protein [Chitinophagaceae bacterium]
MKRVFLSTIVLCIAGLSVTAQSGAKPKAKPAAKPAAPVMKNLLDSFSYAAGVNVATNMKAQGISKLNTAMMVKGIDDVFKTTNNSWTRKPTTPACSGSWIFFQPKKMRVQRQRGSHSWRIIKSARV